MEKFDYSKVEITQALLKVGVGKGDSIFVYSNVGFFGRLKGAVNLKDYYRTFKEAIFEVIGENGTLIFPTFSYSFCHKKIFDKEKTPGVCGVLSEAARCDPEALRSDDANFSIVAIGKIADYFTSNAPKFSFGHDSFWERFVRSNGKFCNFNFDAGSTFLHYIERLLNVPYRYDKAFAGKSIINGKEENKVFYHFVYDKKKPNNSPDFTKFDKRAKESGLAKTANLGKGQIVLISAEDTFKLVKEELKKNPFFLIKEKYA